MTHSGHDGSVFFVAGTWSKMFEDNKSGLCSRKMNSQSLHLWSSSVRFADIFLDSGASSGLHQQIYTIKAPVELDQDIEGCFNWRNTEYSVNCRAFSSFDYWSRFLLGFFRESLFIQIQNISCDFDMTSQLFRIRAGGRMADSIKSTQTFVPWN